MKHYALLLKSTRVVYEVDVQVKEGPFTELEEQLRKDLVGVAIKDLLMVVIVSELGFTPLQQKTLFKEQAQYVYGFVL